MQAPVPRTRGRAAEAPAQLPRALVLKPDDDSALGVH
jgi:hypothetical protein